MRKRGTLIATAAILSAFSLFISSCKKSHETPVKPNLSMDEATRTVKESDGTITVNLVLDRPALSDLTVTYGIDGSTAREKLSANSTNPSYDYAITSDYLETTILKGETTGAITIDLYSDFNFEDDELIDISILSVDKDDVVITREDEEKITVKQEDGLGVLLFWAGGISEEADSADMDLFIWPAGGDPLNDGVFSISEGNYAKTGPEFIFLPAAIDAGTYNLSANYYAGDEDAINFKLAYIPFIDGDEKDDDEVLRDGSYTQANVNAWDADLPATNPLAEFTFENAGTGFTNFSQFDLPSSGSRVGGGSNSFQPFKIIRSNQVGRSQGTRDLSAIRKFRIK